MLIGLTYEGLWFAGSEFQPCLELEVTSRIEHSMCMYVACMPILRTATIYSSFDFHKSPTSPSSRFSIIIGGVEECMHVSAVLCNMKKRGTRISPLRCLCHLSDPAITNSTSQLSLMNFSSFVVSLLYPWYILSHAVIAFRDVKLQTGR